MLGPCFFSVDSVFSVAKCVFWFQRFLGIFLACVHQRSIRFRKKALQRAVCGVAMVFSRAIRLRLIEQDILLADVTNIERGVEHTVLLRLATSIKPHVRAVVETAVRDHQAAWSQY